MSNQHRFSLQALAAIVRELDDKLTDLNRAELAEHHEHLVWLATGASILADLAIEQANSTPTPKPTPANDDAPKATCRVGDLMRPDSLSHETPEHIKGVLLRQAAEKPVCEVVQFDCWTNGSLDLCEPDDDGDAVMCGRDHELLRSLSPHMPVRALIHPDCDQAEAARALRKIADDVESMESWQSREDAAALRRELQDAWEGEITLKEKGPTIRPAPDTWLARRLKQEAARSAAGASKEGAQ